MLTTINQASILQLSVELTPSFPITLPVISSKLNNVHKSKLFCLQFSMLAQEYVLKCAQNHML